MDCVLLEGTPCTLHSFQCIAVLRIEHITVFHKKLNIYMEWYTIIPFWWRNVDFDLLMCFVCNSGMHMIVAVAASSRCIRRITYQRMCVLANWPQLLFTVHTFIHHLLFHFLFYCLYTVHRADHESR